MLEELLPLLRCPICRGCLSRTLEQLTCASCRATYDVVDNVPVLWGIGKRSSALENIDYDALQAINPSTVNQTALQWASVIDLATKDNCEILELGAGTGILTEALLSLNLGSLIASDVSLKFMRALQARLANRPRFKGAVICDANEVVFEPNSFDLVVGRSVLHHFLDYHIVLKNVRSLLRPGGNAIFFEPVLEGKGVISLACAMMLKTADCARVTLPDSDRKLIRHLMRHQTKHAWYPQTREDLAKLEDKYIFRISAMEQLGNKLGYSSVRVVDPNPPSSHWPSINRTLRMAGVTQETIDGFRWIEDVLRESDFSITYAVPSPMVYFVFRN